MEKKDNWKDDVVLRASRETRAKLKLQAALRAISLRDYLQVLANQEKLKNDKEMEDKGYR